MDLEQIKQEVVDVGYRIWLKGMVAANDGNISVRLDDKRILCTPTGVSKGSLTTDMLCVADYDGIAIEEPEGYKVSSEVKMHGAIYRENPDVKCVVHAHPMHATYYAIKGQPISVRALPENIIAMPEIPLSPYGTPSTYQLAENVAPYVKDYPCCLMEFHGAVAWGTSAAHAYLVMERLEFTAQLQFLLDSQGVQRTLPEDEIQKLIGMRAQYGL
ncbi:class II aldolase/adducin family protein [Boudabousia marimammalium]|uniref:Aldolase n=1 Tax=Boudabousia marimammalium TaxID=156892 RepID=A0A1Q5PS99_9ACTO|nr:class II aldolase/adducin family protein [Boudabousia marimammalium]OKL50436.1 aldolase [Boudabousia marimammalium]